MTETISLLVPSRGRPRRLIRMLNSLYEKAAMPSRVEVVLRMDEDDERVGDIRQYVVDAKGFHIKLVLGPSRSMGALNTDCYCHATGDILILANDDIVVQTPKWDCLLVQALKKFDDRIFLGYPNDLHQKEKMTTFPIMHRETLEKLQSPFPEAYGRTYLDLHIMDVFKRIEPVVGNRTLFIPNVIFEHYHPHSGKQIPDNTYHNRSKNKDDVVFRELTQFRRTEASRLISMHNPQARSLQYSGGKTSLWRYLTDLAFFHPGKKKWRLQLAGRIILRAILRKTQLKY